MSLRFIQLIFGGGLVGVAIWLLERVRKLESVPGADPTEGVVLFLVFLAVALAGGVLLAFALLPVLGGLLGGALYGGNEKVGPDPHRDANACVARGDYVGAERAYQRILREQPGDALAVTELVRIQLDRLQLPESAIQTLETALERDWLPEEAGAFAVRLGELYRDYAFDPERAQLVWEQVVEMMPGTRNAANAQARLREL